MGRIGRFFCARTNTRLLRYFSVDAFISLHKYGSHLYFPKIFNHDEYILQYIRIFVHIKYNTMTPRFRWAESDRGRANRTSLKRLKVYMLGTQAVISGKFLLWTHQKKYQQIILYLGTISIGTL